MFEQPIRVWTSGSFWRVRPLSGILIAASLGLERPPYPSRSEPRPRAPRLVRAWSRIRPAFGRHRSNFPPSPSDAFPALADGLRLPRCDGPFPECAARDHHDLSVDHPFCMVLFARVSGNQDRRFIFADATHSTWSKSRSPSAYRISPNCGENAQPLARFHSAGRNSVADGTNMASRVCHRQSLADWLNISNEPRGPAHIAHQLRLIDNAFS